MNNYTVYENIHDFLSKTKDEHIVFCVASNPVAGMVKNLLITAKNNDINLTLFALDNDIVDNIKGTCNIVKYFCKDISKDVCIFNTPSFKNVIWQRFFIGNEILKSGKIFVYMDVDIVIQKNFMNHLLDHYKNTDCDCISQISNIDNTCCTGFISMRPNEKTISVGLDFYEKYNYKRYQTNQTFFKHTVAKVLNIKYLERKLFPIGRYYYENHKDIEDSCYIIHFNWLVGYQNKVNKMKFHNKWLLDD